MTGMIFTQISQLKTYLNKIYPNRFCLKYYPKISKTAFLIDRPSGIIIDLLHSKDDKVISFRKSKFINRKKYVEYIPIVRGEDSLNALNLISRYYSKSAFLNRKAEELNSNVPKSEVWFRGKMEKEPFFEDWSFTYNEVLFGFIYDLFSKKYRVAIEVDGSWHDRPDQKKRDLDKNNKIIKKGWTILRVKAYDEGSYNECIKEMQYIMTTPKRNRDTIQKTRQLLQSRMIKTHA